MLREWWARFAWHLRAVGIAANATRRHMRGESTHTRGRVQASAPELASGGMRAEPGKAKLVDTRNVPGSQVCVSCSGFRQLPLPVRLPVLKVNQREVPIAVQLAGVGVWEAGIRQHPQDRARFSLALGFDSFGTGAAIGSSAG
jgi:hypothetical protein